MSSQPSFRPDIQGLRAVAVIAVVLNHFGVPGFQGGFVGVDLFFVVSGYLITNIVLREILETGGVNYLAFYERRIRRLFPALLVTVVASSIATFAILGPAATSQFAGSTIYSALGFGNIFFWMQGGYFDLDAVQKPLLHLWSLGVEEQFYFFWPALLSFAFLRGTRAIWLTLTVIFAASLIGSILVLPGFAATGSLTDPMADGVSIAFYLTPFRMFEFVIGAALNWLPFSRAPRWTSEIMTGVGFLLVGAATVAFDHTTLFPSYNALIPAFGAGLIMAGAGNTAMGAVLRLPSMVWIGSISYSLYLVHWPLLVFVRYGRTDAMGWVEQCTLLAASLLLAALLYTAVEQPFRKKGGKLHLPRRPLFAASAVAVCIVGIGAVAASDGMQWRFPELALASAPLSAYGGLDCPYPGCVFGDQGEPVLVLGDSFARHLHAGLVLAFPRQRFEFVDQRACAIWSPTWLRWVDEPGHVSRCTADRATTLQRLETAGRVILASNWGHADLFDAQTFAATGRLAPRHLEEGEMAAFYAGEVQRLAEQTGAEILVVANPPDTTPIGEIVPCLLNAADPHICEGSPRAAIDGRSRFARAFADAGLPTIDPYKVMCEGGECPYVGDTAFLYSDQYHLSKAGSMMLVWALRGEFAQFLGASAQVGFQNGELQRP